MEDFFEDYETLGLPGGPNELKRFTNGFIISEKGQWDYPGQPTAVPTPSGRITMKGVEDNLLGIDNLGNTQYMTPGNEYQFEGDMVYEIPQARKGGSKKPSKKYSRSLMAKNKLFAKNSLFEKKKSAKNKIFDPNSPYFQGGGLLNNNMYVEDTDWMGDQYKDIGKDIYKNKNLTISAGNYFPKNLSKQIGLFNPYVNVGYNVKNLGNFSLEAAPQNVGLTFRRSFQDGGFMELELDDNEIEQYRKGGYVVEDISVPSLTRMQPGGPVPDSTYTPIDPNFLAENPDTYSKIVNKPEVVSERQGSDIGKLRAEFREKNPMDTFLDEKKRQYLKKNKGLNKSAGVTMENFPEDVLQNFMNEYDYKTNNYAVNKLGKKEGWNPKRRGEWVDKLTPGERDAVAESKYGSKLQPSYWSRALAGTQELGNFMLKTIPGVKNDVLKFNIPGLTKKEQKEIAKSKLGALETLAPLDIPGAAIANLAKNTGLSTGSDYKEQANALAGEKMANVSDMEALAFNPLTYAGLEAIPELGINIAKGIGKGANKLQAFVKNARDMEKIAKAYDPHLTKAGFSLDMFGKPKPNVEFVGPMRAPADVAPVFKSEIDWVDWLKKHNKNYDAEDIQNIIKNSEEYNIIEQQTKANGTWMKNADGTPFQGTPEQFIQSRSTKFKKAYPEGYEVTYRGGDKKDALESNWGSKSKVVFTTKDEFGARTYNRSLDQPPLSLTETPPEGISQLYMPKTSNKIVIDGNEYPVGHKYRQHGLPYIDATGKEVYSPGSRTNYARLNVIDQVPANELEAKNLEAFKTWMLEKHPTMTERGWSGEPRILNDWVMTDHFADFLNSPAGRNIDRVEFQKIIDGTLQPIDVEVHNLNEAQQLKSMLGNSGEFDLTNPSKFKALLPYIIPTGLGVGIASQMQGQKSNKEYKNGGITSKYGYSVGNLIRKDDGGLVSGTQGLTDDFSQRLTQFILDARAQGVDLGVGSGYRSYEKQKRLWEQALKKYGSPEKARKWVAPPGGSFHNKGLAVDLNSNGQFLGKDANSKATEWAHANAKKYGLHFRMGHEPWHIEPIEKTKSNSEKENEHDHVHDDDVIIDRYGDQPRETTQEEYDNMIQLKNMEFEAKQKELEERERALHDDDYSNWEPAKKEEIEDPLVTLQKNYLKIMEPSSQNVYEQFIANKQGQMKKGGFIVELNDKEIKKYLDGGYIVEELD